METMDKMDWFSPMLFVHTMDAISPMDILDNPGPDKESIACTFFYFPQYKQKGRGVPGGSLGLSEQTTKKICGFRPGYCELDASMAHRRID